MKPKALPKLHPAVEHVWFAYADLEKTRDRGMATGPITWLEIGAYNAETLACLTVWDKHLIRRIDDAAEAIRTGAKPKPTNVASMKATLRGVIAERDARAKAKGAK